MKRVQLIARVMVNLVIFLLVMEVCARVDDYITYRAPILSSYNVDTLYEHDWYGKYGKPGARYKKWQLNSLGFRGPELRRSTVRIVCFGASETFGLYEAEDREYPRQLERILNARAGSEIFQVVNVAYPGETIATAILRVPKIVQEVQPRVALIYPTPAEYIWLPWVRPKIGPAPSERPTQSPWQFEWRIADRFRIVSKTILPKFVQTELRQLEIEREAQGYRVMDRVPAEDVSRFRSDLLGLVSVLRNYSVEPVLITHATVFGEHPAHPDRQILVAWRKSYPMLKEDGFIDMEQRMNGAIRNLAAEQHIRLVDAAREIAPDHANFADFSHFTNVGAGIMASRLADVIQRVNGEMSANLVITNRSNLVVNSRREQLTLGGLPR